MLQKRTALMYSLTPNGNGGGRWESETVPDSIKRGEWGAYVSCVEQGIYFGGRATSGTDDSIRNLDNDHPLALPGLLRYNFEDGNWDNTTNSGTFTELFTYQRGEAVCARIGDRDPLVFAIGGASLPLTDARDATSDYLDMTSVHFWDPKEEKWHRQSVSGRAPPTRMAHCAVGAGSRNGTYEM